MIDSQTTSHDSQPAEPSARRPVTQCLLPRPRSSRVSSHLVINFWPLDCFATCRATCFATCTCFAFFDSNICMSQYKSVQPLSVRPPSARSLVACPAEIHTGRSLSVLCRVYLVNPLTSHILHPTSCQINIHVDDWTEQPEMLQHRQTCLDHAIQWINRSNRASYSQEAQGGWHGQLAMMER